jgi:hypothetical protein
MALKIYLYRAEGIVASDLQPLLAAGANPVVGTTLAPSLVAITVDESHKSDLDDAMASLDYEFDAEYTGGDTLVGRQDFGTLPADPTSPSPATGDTYYNSTLGYTLVYNGTAWVADHGDQPLGDGLDHAVATDTVAGFMSPEDKEKLDDLSNAGASPAILTFGQETLNGSTSISSVVSEALGVAPIGATQDSGVLAQAPKPLVPGTVVITGSGGEIWTDDGLGTLVANLVNNSADGTIGYGTEAWEVNWSSPIAGTAITLTADYDYCDNQFLLSPGFDRNIAQLVTFQIWPTGRSTGSSQASPRAGTLQNFFVFHNTPVGTGGPEAQVRILKYEVWVRKTALDPGVYTGITVTLSNQFYGDAIAGPDFVPVSDTTNTYDVEEGELMEVRGYTDQTGGNLNLHIVATIEHASRFP